MADQRDYAVCGFHLREDAGMHRDGMKYTYTRLWLDSAQGDGKLYTLYPPVVGDLIPLSDREQSIYDTFEVIMRDISYSQYGSANWPYGKQHSDVGPHITYIVVRSTGVFRDEVSEVSQDGADRCPKATSKACAGGVARLATPGTGCRRSTCCTVGSASAATK